MTSVYLEKADQLESKMLQDLRELVAIRSISLAPEYQDECVRCAELLKTKISKIGFAAKLLPTPTKPVVFGEFLVDPSKPTVIFYGHYDIQTVGKEAWTHGDPFSTKVVDGRVYGRGSQDNKGQVTYVLGALESLISEKRLNVNVKLLLEGEEEFGSEGLISILPGISELVKGDILLVCDTDARALGRAGIALSLRGVAITTVTLHGPKRDLHSGQEGGVGPNPIDALAKVISSFHDADGRIMVKDFMSKVRAISPQIAERVLANSPTDEQLRDSSGWSHIGTEKGVSAQISSTLRPVIVTTCVEAGMMGSNSIPASATFRIAARVVPDQDPEESLDQLIAHINSHLPKGITASFSNDRVGEWLYLDSADPLVAIAQEAVRAVTGHDAALIYEGGSISILSTIQRVTGAKPLLLGFGLVEDNIHSRDESFSVQQLKLGFATVCEFLSRL